MLKRSLKLGSCLLMVLVLLLTACTKETSDLRDTYALTFRLAEAHAGTHPTAQAAEEFARRVEEATDGRIKIVVYLDKALGEEKDVIEQVQFGAIDFARVSIAPMAEIVHDLYVLQMPYIYEDREHMWRVLNSEIGDEMLEKIAEEGFIGLTWFDAGARSFYTSDKPIRTLEDLQGQTIRLMENTLMMDMSEAMGFNGVLEPYGQVYSLLQMQEVDGAENNFSSYLTAFHYEVAQYYTMDEHLRVPELIVASEEARDAISEEDWQIILQVAEEVSEYQKDLWTEMEEAAKNELIEQGVTLVELEDRSSFVEAVAPVYEKYEEDFGDLIRRIQMK